MLITYLSLLATGQSASLKIGDFTVTVNAENGYSEEVSTANTELELAKIPGLKPNHVTKKEHSIEITGTYGTGTFLRTIQTGNWDGSINITTQFTAASGSRLSAVPFTYHFNKGEQTWPQESKTQPDYLFTSPVAVIETGQEQLALIPQLHPDFRTWPLSLQGFGVVLGKSGAKLPAPSKMEVSYDIILGKKKSDVDFASGLFWNDRTQARSQMPWPQTMPFSRYAAEAYTFQLNNQDRLERGKGFEEFDKKWFTYKLADGTEVGGPGYQKTVQFESDDNALLSAYGLLVWGEAMKQSKWMAKGKQLIELYLSRTGGSEFSYLDKKWQGKESPVDLAVSGYWLIQTALLAPLDDDLKSRIESQIERIVIATSENSDEPEVKAFLAYAKKNMGYDHLSIEKITKEEVEEADLDDLPWLIATLDRQSEKRLLAFAVNKALLHQHMYDSPYYSEYISFGGFGDDEHGLHPATGLLGITLIEAGLRHERLDWAKRGVIALRSMVSGLHSATDAAKVIKPFPFSIQVGRGSLSYGHEHTDQWDIDHSFEGSVGHMAGILAASLTYGSYTIYGESELGVDAIAKNDHGQYFSLLDYNPISISLLNPFDILVNMNGEGSIAPLETQQANPRIVDIVIASKGAQSSVILAAPGNTMNAEIAKTLKVTFHLGEHSFPAEMSSNGFTATVDNDLLAKFPVVVTTDRKDIPSLTKHLFAGPVLDELAIWPRGWRRKGDLSLVAFPSIWDKDPWLSTADQGTGSRNVGLTGKIVSLPFRAKSEILAFDLRGTKDQAIELVDADTRQVLYHLVTDIAESSHLEWDMRPWLDRQVYIRLLDESQTGYIEVRGFKFSPAGPIK